MAKKLQEVVKTAFCVSRGTICDLKFFKCSESFWIFCRNLWHGTRYSSYVSRVKIAEEKIFFVFLFRIFSTFERNLSDFCPKNFMKLSKLLSACADEQFLAWKFFFLKFWIVLVFLQEPLAWFSNFYLRVQSKIAEEIVFFTFLFRNFSDFEPNFLRLLAKKLQEVVKITFCVCRRTIFGLKKLSNILNRFRVSAKTFGMVLKRPSRCPE